MDIEKALKKKHPNWSDAIITARRIEGFKNLFGNQQNYFNWKSGIVPQHDNLMKVCKEFDLDIYKLSESWN